MKDFTRTIKLITNRECLKSMIPTILVTIGLYLVGLFCCWVLISYVEVITHNMQTGYEYAEWNFFEVLIKCKS